MCPTHPRVKNMPNSETPMKGFTMDKAKIAKIASKAVLGVVVSTTIGYLIKGEKALGTVLEEHFTPKPSN